MKITAYSLSEFCKLTQDAIKQGYVFDFDSNENFPQTYGSFLECTMVMPAKQEEVKLVVTPVVKTHRKNSTD